MAIFHTFTGGDAESASEAMSGNLDLSVKGLEKGKVRVQVQYPGSSRWDSLLGATFSPSAGQGNIDKIIIAGDSAVSYKFVATSITGSVECYLGAS